MGVLARICAATLLLLAPLHAFRPVAAPRLAPLRAAAPRLAPLRTALSAAADAPTLNQQINELGLSLKAKGVQQRDKFVAAAALPAKAKHLVGAGLLFGVFVCYRVYRGFFVLLPAVFDEVRNKVKTEMLKKYGADADLDPKTGALRRKTAALVNAASCFFTVILLVRTLCDSLALGLSRLGSGTLKREAKEEELDLPPLPSDIPDVALPDTDELPPASCCD